MEIGNSYDLAFRLIDAALPIWKDYAFKKRRLTYRDTIAGLVHHVDRDLLENTLNSCRSLTDAISEDSLKVAMSKLYRYETCFEDPIIAIQDSDWNLPEAVECVFYSVYNLLRSVLGKVESTFGESSLYVSINQASNALILSKRMSPEAIAELNTGLKTDIKEQK
jgi:hypothetical protein